MKQSLSFFCVVIVFFVISSCRKSDIASGIPNCIRKEIATHKDDLLWDVGKVSEYFFQDKLDFGFDHGLAADGSLEIKDEFCNTICFVGGFGGPAVNSCNGENFFQMAVLRRNIWERK